jgi:hypothetical protein
VAFFVVYIKEADPEDGWVLSSNRSQGIAVTDPASDHERSQVARVCSPRLEIRMPVLLDAVTTGWRAPMAPGPIGSISSVATAGWPGRAGPDHMVSNRSWTWQSATS